MNNDSFVLIPIYTFCLFVLISNIEYNSNLIEDINYDSIKFISRLRAILKGIIISICIISSGFILYQEKLYGYIE